MDVRNAFNSTRWKNIFQALDKLDVPAYLKNMIKSYLTNRLLVYDTEDGPKEYQITGRVPQGLVLGSSLWNIMYDDLLRILLPPEAEMVAFADDARLIITGKNLEKIRRILGDCCEEVQQWMKSVGLELADHKTEAVVFTSRKKIETITIDIGQCTITSQPNVRYLGMMLDTRLNFKAHVKYLQSRQLEWPMH